MPTDGHQQSNDDDNSPELNSNGDNNSRTTLSGPQVYYF
jgi:hypothetical protein